MQTTQMSRRTTQTVGWSEVESGSNGVGSTVGNFFGGLAGGAVGGGLRASIESFTGLRAEQLAIVGSALVLAILLR